MRMRKYSNFERGSNWYLSAMASSSQNVAPSSSAASSSSKANGRSLSMPKDGHSVTKRLQQDLTKLMMTSNTGVSAFPDGDNLFHWIGTISGAEGTAYAGLDYKLSFSFPSRYPYSPPVVKFTTPCYHPNIDDHGNICLDILKEKWSALYDVRTILLSLQSLLGEPNNASPLNVEAADLWSDQPAFKKMVVKKYKDATAAL